MLVITIGRGGPLAYLRIAQGGEDLMRWLLKKLQSDLVAQFEKKHPSDRLSQRNYTRLLTKHDEVEQELKRLQRRKRESQQWRTSR